VAVVQISRIQHRRGTSDNLPQLAVGEIGLAVDTRKVYIGNGGTDAPSTENIELLTSVSSVISTADSYTYSGYRAGYSSTTGASANTPSTRTLQQKLDDVASVIDFGATGDGTTDDSAAINRALYELFSREANTKVRRSLYFPAGTYIVRSVIKIPTYAKLVGEGPESSIIKGTNSAVTEVARTADSLQQIASNIGNGTGVQPKAITIEGISFNTNVDIDGFVVDQSEDIHFRNCSFNGQYSSAPASVGNSNSTVLLTSTAGYQTEHITFTSCQFSGHNLGVLADHDMKNIVFNGCSFKKLFKGFKIGENKTGSSPAIIGPKGMSVTNSLFDKIYSSAVHVYAGPGFTSSFNTYRDCANNVQGSGNPTAHVVNYTVGECYAIGDIFDRLDSDTTTYARVSVDRNHVASLAMEGSNGVKFGGYIRQYGQSITLDNNSTKSTGLLFADNGNNYAIEISYLITRGSLHRQGVMRITHNSTAQSIDDDFSENSGDIGVTFNLTNTSNQSTLNYVTSNTVAGTLFYSIRIIR
jgi:hypothetical protein